MHFRAITRIVGLLVILFSGTMIIPGLVALIYRDDWLPAVVAKPP